MFPFLAALLVFSTLSGCGSDVAVQMDDGTYVFPEEEWNSEEAADTGDGWNEYETWETEESEYAEATTEEEGFTTTEEVSEQESEGTFFTGETEESFRTEEREEYVAPVEVPDHQLPVRELDMGILNTVQDYGPDGMGRGFEARPLFHLLSYIANMSNEHCEDLDFEEAYSRDMLAAPSQYRGMPLRIWGKVVWLDEKVVPCAGEYAGAPSTLFHGLLMDEDGEFCYFLTMDPPVWLINEKEVWVYGFFFRNYAYKTKTGKMYSAPVVTVKYFEED
jgi:hypothetical protein